jgi:DNA polymerase-3 subunit delta'
LKTLEEPVPSTLLILITEDPTRLAATVLSRCQRIEMLPPEAELAQRWLGERIGGADVALLLRLAHGAPLRALTLAATNILAAREQGFDGFLAIAKRDRDPVSGAEALQQFDPALVLEWLSTWTSDLLRLGQDTQVQYLSNPDKRAELATLASGLDGKALHRFLHQVLRARALLAGQVNRGLLFEALLVEWARLNRRA